MRKWHVLFILACTRVYAQPQRLDPLTGLTQCTDIPASQVCAVPTFEGADDWIAQDYDIKYSSRTFNNTAINTNDKAIFAPNVTIPGNYSVSIWSPGCRADATCRARGTVNITGRYSAAGKDTAAVLIQQTNDFYKFDEIHVGFVDAVGTAFRHGSRWQRARDRRRHWLSSRSLCR
ncbi:hypothetical protein EJ04DRAFT_184001 [Polyplosphaeria fusca]|uniref:Rax2-like third domain-containing protein n=1 Tax=Polyplosphaeria fusca TaxID=682080 RepID=A0A9P4R2S7_9PLEO|nr:hypothetical protein EJ04DRAFT_184001 [Polyplosphaeria fusca]